MTLARAMATVGGMTMLSRIAGFARDLVTSHHLGAGPIADAFFVALKLPNFFRSITAEGAFSIAFVPLYTDQRTHHGQTAASNFAAQAVSIMVAGMLPFSILMMWAMPWVMVALAPGFADDPYKLNLATEMGRLSFPYLILVSVAAMLGAVLNAHNKFGPYAVAPVLFNLCLIASVYVIAPFTETEGHAMALGMSISGALQAAWVYLFIRKMGLHIRFTWPRLNPDVRQLFRKMGPGILVAGVFQVNLFANLTIASLAAPGTISYLYYADRLYQLPFGVIGIAVGTALLPLFAQALARHDQPGARDLYNRSIEYMLLLSLPCTVGLLLTADPVVRIMYEHGKFNSADAYYTTLILMTYALGLPAYILTRVYNAVFYAHKDTWSPVRLTLITAGLNVVLSFLFAYALNGVGIALSAACVGWLQLYLLIRAVRAEKYALTPDDRLQRNLPRIFLCAGLLAAFLFILRYGLHDAFAQSFFIGLGALLALIASAVVFYAVCLFATRLLVPSDLKRFFTRKERLPKDDPALIPD